MALFSYLVIVDFPELSTNSFGFKFLNEKEAAFVVARIEKDRHDAIPEEFKLGKYLKSALDLKVWGFAALFGLTTTNTYAIAYFLPIILNEGMGFGVAASQCLISPPYVLAAIVMYAFAVLGDKYHLRSPFILINGCLLLIGKCALISTKSSQYADDMCTRPSSSWLSRQCRSSLFWRLHCHGSL